jgi:hypothetical protein
MTAPDWLRLGGGLTALPLADGRSLRLLTDREILEARREGLTMEGDRALNSNACLLARALVREGEPVYLSGRTVRKALSPEEIQDLAGAWAAFDRRENPGLTAPEARVEDLKNALNGLSQERLKWKVLRAFGVLPNEARARAMTGRDYLWCALHLLLDEEELLDRLCPACRAQAEEERCPVCGGAPGERTAETNGAFDWDRFRAMREG